MWQHFNSIFLSIFAAKSNMIMTQKDFTPRRYMEMVVEVMKNSIQEPRSDKVSPKVGALLIKPDGTIETAYRGELRQGDHAEFTLLERKNRSVALDGSMLFATLEPCAPGARKHPKLSCAERIVNARISKVWIGIEDPDPAVDRKGIKYLIDNGVEVEMFDADLQDVIRDCNKQFIKEAEERAKSVNEETVVHVLTEKERVEPNSSLKEDFSKDDIVHFLKKANIDVEISSPSFSRVFAQLGMIEERDGEYIPTGLGLLLFGKKPQLLYPNARIQATFKTANRKEEIATIGGSLLQQAINVVEWCENHINKQIVRSQARRQTIYDYPMEVIRETALNSICHRDYDIEGAPIYVEINDEAIIIKSPGLPVEPLTMEQMKQLNAPSLSRNPKIMYVFDQMDLVEQRGLGFQTIKELPKQNLPLPVVTYEAPYMVFTFPRDMKAFKDVVGNDKLKELNEDELRGYNYIRLIKSITRKEYEVHFGYDTKKAERHLTHLMELNLVERKGSGPYTHYVLL
jgi:ATP-dependent DNA helicase RecG